MTYCLAIALEEGLVFCSDSRTNAGPDRVSTYSKMHRFSVPYERSMVILTAGNLADASYREPGSGIDAPGRHLSIGLDWRR